MVADTGSTNGTFINGQRIAYGKAFAVKNDDKLKFGTVEVSVEHILDENKREISAGDFETKKEISAADEVLPDKTVAINDFYSTKEISELEKNGTNSEQDVLPDVSEKI